MTAQEIRDQVRALPTDERAELLDQLVVDMARDGFDDSVADEWADEIRRRAAVSRSGKTLGEPWETVRDDVQRRLAEGSSV